MGGSDLDGSDLAASGTLALCALLREAFADLPGAPEVVAAAPWKALDHGACVHLFEIAPDRTARNLTPPTAPNAPAAFLTLRFLVSFFGPDDVRIHRLAGRALCAVTGAPLMERVALQAAAQAGGLPGEAQAGTRMRVSVDPLGIAEMTSLWQRFSPMRYALSLAVRCEIAA